MTIKLITRPEPRHDDHGWPSPPDPGDLSRRIAQRRVELHLSQAQLAARAGLTLRYLEYLERYPARPNAATLRQLAAALRTTPGALLGGGANVPPGQHHLADIRFISKLMPAECRRLITPGGVGRIAFSTSSGPVVVPVNFAVLADTIVVRTAEGTVIDGHADELAALEVDHIDEALCQAGACWCAARRTASRIRRSCAACRRTLRSGRGLAASARSTCGSCPVRSPAAGSSCGRVPCERYRRAPTRAARSASRQV